VEGKINNKRPRGCPTCWMDETKEIIGRGLQEASLAAQEQDGEIQSEQ